MDPERRKGEQEWVGQQEKSHLLLECKMSSFIRKDSKVDFPPKSRQQRGFILLHHLFHQLARFSGCLYSFSFFSFFFQCSTHKREIILVCVNIFINAKRWEEPKAFFLEMHIFLYVPIHTELILSLPMMGHTSLNIFQICSQLLLRYPTNFKFLWSVFTSL